MQHQGYMQQHGTSYYLANRFFPKEIRQDVFVLYAFVRIADDIVDDPDVDPTDAKQQLDDFVAIFDECCETYTQNKSFGPGSDESIWKTVSQDVVQMMFALDIPIQWMHDFFDTMYMDIEHKSYETYAQLQQYMYGSAEVIGLMMCKIVGYDNEQEQEVFRTAKLLGEAMQYTNFLRDIAQDYEEFGRIYMPSDRLGAHNLHHDMLIGYTTGVGVDEAWRVYMRDQIVRTKQLYREAHTGISLLHPEGRRAVRVASWMYESILDKISRLDGDVFTHSARTTKWEKLTVLVRNSRLYAFGYID